MQKATKASARDARSRTGGSLAEEWRDAAPALFNGMDDAGIRLILDHATTSDYPSRFWLYREGERSQQMFFIQTGLVRLSQLTPEGEDLLVRFVPPGRVFGYFSLALGDSNISSAQVMVPSRLMAWDVHQVLQIMKQVPTAALNLFNVAVRDLFYFYERSRHLQADSVSRRAEWALVELVRSAGVPTTKGLEIARGVGQREVAELAGTNVFTVSRELGRLERRGILEKSRGRILVMHPEKLRQD